MLLNRNEEYLLKFVSRADEGNELIKAMSILGVKPHSQEYNPVYQIIDELNIAEIFRKEV